MSAKKPARHFFEAPDVFATPMLALLVDEFGAGCLNWAPETLVLEIESQWKAHIREPNLTRLMSGRQVLVSDDFYSDAAVFNDLCLGLAGHSVHGGWWLPADAGECAWGITEAYLLSPPDGTESFDEDVKAFVGFVVRAEGILRPPQVLQLALPDDGAYRKAESDFADDPNMYKAIYDVEQGKSEDIEREVKDNLHRLFSQLRALPLEHGDAERLFSSGKMPSWLAG